MRFLVDNQLPVALARLLTEQGHDADHVLDAGLDEAGDLEIWNEARAGQAWLVSKDEDFFHLANRPNETGRLIWVRLGNCRNAALLERFESDLPSIASAEKNEHRIIEIR